MTLYLFWVTHPTGYLVIQKRVSLFNRTQWFSGPALLGPGSQAKLPVTRLVIYTVEFASELRCRFCVEFYVTNSLVRCRNCGSNPSSDTNSTVDDQPYCWINCCILCLILIFNIDFSQTLRVFHLSYFKYALQISFNSFQFISSKFWKSVISNLFEISFLISNEINF